MSLDEMYELLGELEIHAVYHHFKGDNYLVCGIEFDKTQRELMVVYRGLYGKCEEYRRPVVEFLEVLDKKKYPGAKQVHRFELKEIPSVKSSYKNV